MTKRSSLPVLFRPIWLVSGCVVISLVWSFWVLSPGFIQLDHFSALVTFLLSAFNPAVSYQAEFVPIGTDPLLLKACKAAGTTVVFAGAGLSLALLVGIPLGFLCSTSFWQGIRDRPMLLPVATFCYSIGRIVITFFRSVHELLWAVLFLAAFGLTESGAALAIAIPYAGIFAKVFSDMIDECPTDSSNALRESGASTLQSFLFGRLPRALPDMAAYSMYRFECAVRSSAVLGFFGIPTLGFYVSASFENLYYRKVWTYLYVLFVLLLILDIWSNMLREGLAR